MINLFQPSLGKEELAEIEKVFASNWIGKGGYVERFEEMFAQSLKSERSRFLSTTSCTEAIFLSGDLFDFSEEDEVIVPSVSFPSVASSIISRGAKIIFCDVDPHTLNVRAEDIEPVITPRTKALFVTHYGGIPCEMDAIRVLCETHDIRLIEDSACAVRSFYKGEACGTMGDMGMWSFDAMKTLCTGDGGMIYLKDPELMDVAKEQLYLGLPVKQKSGLDSSASGSANWWEFELNRPGRRAIMNNIAGAIGTVQVEKVAGFIARRKEIYERYLEGLGDLEWLRMPPEIPEYVESSYYFFWVQTPERDRLARYLLDHEVYTTFRYWPLHKVKYLERYVTGSYPNSDYAAAQTLDLPLHQSLADGEVEKIIDLIRKFR
ncbi:MAG: hypothetical protein B6D59_02505 [Campylobacteraceae bacterium 4484_4]|nr:MAG: hypothetical protein B6D59_02505 [Campylobacteraceae bacterium 4484_4]